MLKKAKLETVEYLTFKDEILPPKHPGVGEINTRLSNIRKMMTEQNLTHIVVYGDKEHFSNIKYFIDIDPRFEEALLIIKPSGKPTAILGIECAGYIIESSLYKAKELNVITYQTFSVTGSQRDNEHLDLSKIFSDEGIGKNSKVGSIGWRYYNEKEFKDFKHAIEVPSFIIDTLRNLVSFENVINATDLMHAPEYGLRAVVSAYEAAYYDYTNRLASLNMKNMIFALKDGMTDYDVVSKMNYTGEPLTSHMTFSIGTECAGLTSVKGRKIKKGEPFCTNVSYYGTNICRFGWLIENESELPEKAKNYLSDFAFHYQSVMNEYVKSLHVGANCGAISDMVDSLLSKEKYNTMLNHGHLIHDDEWLSSPFYHGSKINIRSGMIIQVDIIPQSENYASARMEEGFLVADEKLRKEIESKYPDVYKRCMARREYMKNTLGFDMSDDLMPLSDIPGLVTPFLFSPNKAIVLFN